MCQFIKEKEKEPVVMGGEVQAGRMFYSDDLLNFRDTKKNKPSKEGRGAEGEQG